jgi:hypothetical protein
MKKLLISTIFAIVICVNVSGQGDPAVSSVTFTTGTVGLGQTTVLSIELTNNDFVLSQPIPSGGYQVSVSLPASLVYRAEPLNASAMTHVSGPLFSNITYDGTNVFTADLAAPQGVGVISKLQITVRGLILTPTAVPTGIQVGALIAGVASSDNNSNNNLAANLQVVTVLPIKLGSVNSEVADCSAKLKWNTLEEESATNFDVEFSTDGSSFFKLAEIAGKKSSTGASYEYTYTQGNGKGYYRLKINDGYGGYFYSKVVNTNITCNAKTVSVFPNPIQNSQILRVIVANFKGKVKGDLFGADGKLISTHILQNGVNKITITGLLQAAYNFKVTDDGKEIKSYKVIVVN